MARTFISLRLEQSVALPILFPKFPYLHYTAEQLHRFAGLPMTWRFIWHVLIVFVLWSLGYTFIHNVLLESEYQALYYLFRIDDAEQYTAYLLLAHVIISIAFVALYRFIPSRTHWFKQGLQYALLIVFLNIVPTDLMLYATQPLSMSYLVKLMLYESLLVMLMSMVVAILER
jgi:hypothetical protein